MQENVRLEIVERINKIIINKEVLLNSKKDLYILIASEFRKVLSKNNGNTTCNHEVWLYNGYIEKTGERRYKCLECTKTVKIKNWYDFEKENNVLKQNYPSKIEQYIKLYYLLLFKYNTKQAQQKVISEFYKTKKEEPHQNQRKRK